MIEHQIADTESLEADLDLYEAVTQALMRLPMVRESHVPLEVTLRDGVVTLSGIVLSPIMRRAVLYAAAAVPGVRKVIDQLVDDQQIQMAVAQALAADPLLKQSGRVVTVRSYRGDVTLSGKVVGEKERSTALAVASRVPGVRRVFDELEVIPS